MLSGYKKWLDICDFGFVYFSTDMLGFNIVRAFEPLFEASPVNGPKNLEYCTPVQ